jgi:S1-C subfamily serine protease
MLDGEAVASLDDFAARLKAFKPGDSVKLIVVEDGKEKPVAVTLGAREN